MVALKGARTVIADAGRRALAARGRQRRPGHSGSGDVLAGIIAGLARARRRPGPGGVLGRGAACGAGERLAARMGMLGYLARELPDEIPALLERFSRPGEAPV